MYRQVALVLTRSRPLWWLAHMARAGTIYIEVPTGTGSHPGPQCCLAPMAPAGTMYRQGTTTCGALIAPAV
ncbi:hypothetical protein GDO78_021379 [Eleutherodactylus coqui]|uniref:Uncharacterized protein n=1 Tax=Eleutherodactylus coqui TaxID=57060 RepID=A0A8J6K1R3_ELECQ|nr:hypothetical protein GDO78_021379 [Eleutherodactylus coqui]